MQRRIRANMPTILTNWRSYCWWMGIGHATSTCVISRTLGINKARSISHWFFISTRHSSFLIEKNPKFNVNRICTNASGNSSRSNCCKYLYINFNIHFFVVVPIPYDTFERMIETWCWFEYIKSKGWGQRLRGENSKRSKPPKDHSQWFRYSSKIESSSSVLPSLWRCIPLPLFMFMYIHRYLCILQFVGGGGGPITRRTSPFIFQSELISRH